MVAHVLRLRLSLLFGSLRGGRPVGAIAGFLVVALLTVIVSAATLSVADAALPVARTVIVLGAAVVFLGFLLGPLLVGAVDPLDPRRFAVFGLDERALVPTLALASLLSIPSFAVIAVGICVVIVTVAHGAAWFPALLAGLIGALSMTLSARISMAINAALLPERRSRELTTLFALAAIVIAFPVAVFLGSMEWGDEVPGAIATAAQAFARTPFGATVGFSFALAEGNTGEAWLCGAIAVATLLVLGAVWVLLVHRLLLTTERPNAARERTGLGWFAILPANAFGAIAARSLVYWLRDRRYIVNILVVPVAGALTVLPLLVAGVPMSIALLMPVPVMALFFGWLPHNDVAYDSTAFWTHVVSGARGISDRFGRLIPIVLVAVPVLALAIPLSLSIVAGWHLLLPLTGLAASLFLSGLGLSSISSVVSPYAVSHPGDSPFQQPQRAASRGSFGQAGVFLGALLFSVPTIWLFARTVMDEGTPGGVVFWCGLGTGIVVLAAGAVIGGAIYERSGEQIMEFVETS